MKALLFCLLILSSSPAWSKPLTVDEIVSSIEPAQWYQGSDVRDAISQILLIAQDEIKATAEQAVIAATTEILAQRAQIASQRDWWRVGALSAGIVALCAFVAFLVK